MANQVDKKHRSRRRRTKRPANKGHAYVLIGMPGSGKSVLGRRVAKLLAREFVDTDNVLSERVGMTVGEFSQSASNEQFRAEEEAAVLSVKRGNKIIATGGSVVYGKRAMNHLKQIGTIIYLDQPLWMIVRRIGDSSQRRGIILRPGQSIGDIYHERKGLYKRYADIEFHTRRLSPNQSAKMLANVIRFLEEPLSDAKGSGGEINEST